MDLLGERDAYELRQSLGQVHASSLADPAICLAMWCKEVGRKGCVANMCSI